MTKFLAVLLAMYCSLAGAANAAEHQFIQMAHGPFDMVFWDRMDVSRVGGATQTTLLTAHNMAGATSVWADRLSIDCKWHSFRIIEPRSMGSNLETRPRTLPLSALEPGFAEDGSGEQRLIGIICDHATPEPSKIFGTAIEALTYGFDALESTSQTLVVPSPPPAASTAFGGFPKDHFDLRIVASEPHSGNLALVDWANIARKGPIAHVVTVSIIGQRDVGAPAQRYPAVNLTTKVFDCDNPIFEDGDAVLFFKDGAPAGKAAAQPVAHHLNDGSIELSERNAVCSGKPVGVSFHDLGAAMDYADKMKDQPAR
jgi:hypothetical protein